MGWPDRRGNPLPRPSFFARDPGLKLKAAKALKGLGYFREALRQAEAARSLEASGAAAARIADLENLLERGRWSAPRPRPVPEILDDARVDLLSALWALAGPPAGGSFEFDSRSAYAQSWKRALRPWRKHPAAGALKAALGRGLARPGPSVRCSIVPAAGAQGPAPLGKFGVHGPLLEALALSRGTRVGELWAACRRERRAWISEVGAQRESMDFIALMEEYSGMKVRAATP